MFATSLRLKKILLTSLISTLHISFELGPLFLARIILLREFRNSYLIRSSGKVIDFIFLLLFNKLTFKIKGFFILFSRGNFGRVLSIDSKSNFLFGGWINGINQVNTLLQNISFCHIFFSWHHPFIINQASPYSLSNFKYPLGGPIHSHFFYTIQRLSAFINSEIIHPFFRNLHSKKCSIIFIFAWTVIHKRCCIRYFSNKNAFTLLN